METKNKRENIMSRIRFNKKKQVEKNCSNVKLKIKEFKRKKK